MIAANCPRCAEAFRVPTGELPEDAYAQCPWCCETFPLNDVIESLPPLLQVLSPDGQPIERHPSAAPTAFQSNVDGGLEASFADPVNDSLGTVVDDGTGDGMPFGQFGHNGEMDESATMLEDTVTEDSDEWGTIRGDESNPKAYSSPVAPMRVTQSPGRRRQKNAGFRTFLGILLGGFAALPIAGGLLILLGQTPDLGFWPFEGERSSAPRDTNAPPSMFDADAGMGFPMDGDESDVAAVPETDPADMAIQEIVGQTGQDLVSAEGDTQLPDQPNELNLPVTDPASGESANQNPEQRTSMVAPPLESSEVDLPAASLGSSETESAEAITMPEVDAPSPVAIVPIESTSPQQDTSASSDAVGDREVGSASADGSVSPPVADSDDLIASVSRAELMVQQFSESGADQVERNVLLRNAYIEIAKACSLAEHQSVALGRLASTIKASPVRDEIGFAGSLWIDVAKRPSDGIALIGKPGSGAAGPNLTLESGKVVNLTVETPLPAGEKVLAMGRVVDGEPSTVEVLIADELP